VHIYPLPEKPDLHVQEKLPGVFVQLAFLEQLFIPNVHSSISTHEPEDVSWYPALQTQMEESVPVILQIAPLPQLQSLTAVVVNCILADVKAGEEVVEIICGVVVVAS
jgi:hypothetical protein